jgi:two-component system chemotaxis response regulator CheB
MKTILKVLVIEDDIQCKQVLLTSLEQMNNADCVGTASTAALALRKIEVLQPDIVLLNPRLANSDALKIVQQLKTHCPCSESIVIAHTPLEHHHLMATVPVVAPQQALCVQDAIVWLHSALQPLFESVQYREHLLPQPQPTIAQASKQTSVPLNHHNAANKAGYELCVLGISTGGPKALEYLIPRLDSAIQSPIIIVQHMPPLFTASLATKLNSQTPLQVHEASDGEPLRKGHIYIAAGGKHLLLKKQDTGELYFEVKSTPPVNNCRPSVDVLFCSVAQIFKGRVLAVIMTGMGRDGTEGVRLLKQKHAHCLIQDKATSVVWGMPGSVYTEGLADEVVALEQLGSRMSTLLSVS